MRIKEQAYAGLPSQLPGVCEIYPGMMIDMLKMGSDIYSTRLNLLLLTESEIEEILKKKKVNSKDISNITPLSYLLKSAELNEMFFLELKNAFSTFIQEEILLLPKINSVLVGSPEEKRLITNKNFSDFQDILRIQNRKEVPMPPENESEIAKKMRLKREERERVKKQQAMKNSKAGGEIADLLEIAETYGIDYKEKSIYAFYGLLQRHQLREKWEQDIRMLCAGASSEKIKAKYWGENPEN